SNLKNNYSPVKLWHYTVGNYANTGLQFCGLMMADHSKCGINTMFNTGTVVGIGANVFGAGFPRKFIPSFAWGGEEGFSTFLFPKFLETAQAVVARRGLKLDSEDERILRSIFDLSKNYRIWETSS
ncbi:MAG: glucose-1-phosphate thymidylyltransferase, partial [Algoriphagus sp.]